MFRLTRIEPVLASPPGRASLTCLRKQGRNPPRAGEPRRQQRSREWPQWRATIRDGVVHDAPPCLRRQVLETSDAGNREYFD